MTGPTYGDLGVGRRLKVLYLTHHAPWPATSGGRLRDAALLPHLARYCDLEVWAVSRTADPDRAALDGFRSGFRVRIFDDEAPRRSYPTRDSRAVRWLLGRPDPETGVTGARFDVIHVEGHYLFHLIPTRLAARVAVVEHNIESHVLSQRALHDPAVPDPDADLPAVRRAERFAWETAGLTLTLSAEDRRRLLRMAPGVRVARCHNGADHVPLRPPSRSLDESRLATAPRVGFIANYAYPPNRDALRWLLEEIVPLLHRRMPGAELVLAGVGLHDAVGVGAIPPRVRVLGRVDRVTAFWDAIDVMVCPLRIGGGVKVKMLEAIRGGCLTVSTGVSLEGLPREACAAVIQVEDSAGLAEAVTRLCTTPQLRRDCTRRLFRAQAVLPRWADAAGSLYRQWLGLARRGTVPRSPTGPLTDTEGCQREQ